MKSAVIDGFKRWKDYSGRSTRAQFWWFYAFFLLSPILSVLLSLSSSIAFWSVDQSRLGQVSILFSFAYLLLVPPMIALQIRRMHDVGKSGWFILVPVYNHYLYFQPAREQGRIPGWIFAERSTLVLVGILLISVLTDGTSALGGFIFWSAIYLGIRFRNLRKRKTKN